MKAFWTLAPKTGTGQSGDAQRPLLPAVITDYSNAGSIYLLTEGVAGAEHRHIILGGVSVAANDLHYHNIYPDGSTDTVGAADHLHPRSLGYFLVFIECEDQHLQACLDQGLIPLAFADTTGGESGELIKEAWTVEQRGQLNALGAARYGLQIPAGIAGGAELINWMIGSLLSRTMVTEDHFR